VRVALAFLMTSAVALAGLGAFVHVRMGEALDERLRDTVAAEADRLVALPEMAQVQAIRDLGGDVHAQSLTADGSIRASSRLVAGPLLTSSTGQAAEEPAPGFREGVARVFDDDAAADGDREAEREDLVLSVRRTDDGYLVVGTSREDADEALAQLRNQLLLGVPLALLVAGGLGYVVAGVGLRPIERMRARAATISDRTAGERLPVPGADDELRRLAVTLNAMLERLDEGLQRERRFVAEASHELRTPLTLMLTEVELALAQPRPPEELTRALSSINQEVRRLIDLAEDLLATASADGGALKIVAHPVDLGALAGRVAERFRSAAGDRSVTVIAPRPVEVQGDAVRLERALSNLIDNALRHGAGDIAVDVLATRAGAVVTVTDEGTGFPDDLAATFTGNANGLGLTIVREIARAHGGTIEIRRDDNRTSVSMELPSLRSGGQAGEQSE
jgi:signal transduction histidine kinase